MHSGEVLRDVLRRANLTEPCADMPLWKYPVTSEHLACLRREFAASGGVPTKASRERQGALALLIAHLLCERLRAGAWRWEPVLSALNWSPNPPEMQRLREHVGDGLEHYWQRRVRSVAGDREYLGSLLIEGGLPLCWLTGEGGPRVQQLLQRLVRLAERHRVPASSLAGEHRDLLPATLRNDEHITGLVSDMADALVLLRRRLPANCESPAEYLDIAEPGWRQRLPIPRMRISSDLGGVDRLVAQLLATTSAIDRESSLVVLEWRLTVSDDSIVRDVVLANRVSVSTLARELQQSEDALPWMLYLCLESSTGRRVQLARLERTSDGSAYVIVPTGPALHVSDRDEWRATLFANRAQCGEFMPVGGDVLDNDVPWVFDDYERASHLLLACGSCELRSETLIVSTPISAVVQAGVDGVVEPIPELRALGRHYYRVLGRAQILVDGETFTVASAEKNAPAASRLRVHGRRLWLGASGTSPLWGVPRVIAESDEIVHDVPVDELEWRPSSGFGRWRRWREEHAVGDVTVRWRKHGRTRARLRTTVLPADFTVMSWRGRVENGTRLAARSLETVVVLGGFPAEASATGRGEFLVSATDLRPSSCEILVRLSFSNSCACELRLPIPKAVTGFVGANGVWLHSGARRSLARSDVLCARGAGSSEFQLDARCPGSPWETVAVVKAGTSGWAELHLDTVREQLESMLSSTNLDGVVELRFSPRGRPGADSRRLLLAHYGLSIEYDIERGAQQEIVGFVCRVCAHDEQARGDLLATQPTLVLISLACPWETWVPLDVIGGNQFRIGVGGLKPGPHLVVAFHGALMRTRPKFLAVPGVVDTSVSAIAALASETDRVRRAEQWRALIAAMSRDFWHPAWADAGRLMETIDALPPSTFEMLRYLADDAEACAMCLLRQRTVDHQRIVLRLLTKLGVLPETIPLPAWLRAMRRIVDAVRGRPGLVDVFGDLAGALNEVARASFGPQPSSALELGDVLRCLAVRHVKELPRPVQDYLALPVATINQHLLLQWRSLLSRHTDDQWPQSTLEMTADSVELPMLDCNGYQRSVQLAPRYAADAAFRGEQLTQAVIRQLHQLKAFDRDWFVIAYSIHLTLLAQRRPAAIKDYLNDI